MKSLFRSLLLPGLLALASFAQALEYPRLTGEDFARTFPYSMTGQLLYDSGKDTYSGSGTVIRPSSVLTAGHNLWDFRGGWSTDILFRRGLYNGASLSQQYANRIYVLAGYRPSVAYFGPDSVRSFTSDLGAIRFSSPVANGAYAGWSTKVNLLRSGAYNIGLGYGGEFHSGDDLLSVVPSQSFYQTWYSFYENESIYIEAGMSGGPVFARDTDGQLYVVAVIVAGAVDPIAGGVRVLNPKAARFIRKHLR